MKANFEKMIDVGEGHQIYVAEYGNPNAAAIVSIHGGPGSKSKIHHAQRFDLDRYRVILFDQRSSGKSTADNILVENNTQNILSDIEKIRERLNIDSWFVCGASWGSTLALLYAQKNPKRVLGLLLANVWLARKKDLDWAYSENGAARMMPDLWDMRKNFLRKFKAEENTAEVLLNVLENNSTEFEVQQEVVAGMYSWDGNLFSPFSRVGKISPDGIDEVNINNTKVFLNFEKHDYFITENQILSNINLIKNIPTIIVSGRYDVLTPLEQAYALNESLDNSKLVIAESSGHSFNTEAITMQYQVFDSFLEKNSK